jgi:hypothetical protein
MNIANLVFIPAAKKAQAERGSAKPNKRRIAEGFPDKITPELATFIAQQDTAFLATATADGAPYIQHRGGPKGFTSRHSTTKRSALPTTAAIGNTSRWPISPKTITSFCSCSSPRAASASSCGRARVVENDAVLVEWLFESGRKTRPERAILFAIEVWDVNCASHIITRFFEAEIEQTLSTVQAKIAELETENTRLRSLLA